MSTRMRLSFQAFSPRRRPKGGAGNALVESALCMLLFLTIFLAFIEFGMGIYAYNFVAYAAREGARYASTRGSLSGTTTADAESALQTRIVNQAVALDTNHLSIATSWNPNNTPGNSVTVNVSYQITPILGFLLGNITVHANSTMMIAQ